MVPSTPPSETSDTNLELCKRKTSTVAPTYTGIVPLRKRLAPVRAFLDFWARTEHWLIPGFVLSIGLGLGLGLPLSEEQAAYEPQGLGRLSAVLGWTYFAAWTISFYPQVCLWGCLPRSTSFSLSFPLVSQTL